MKLPPCNILHMLQNLSLPSSLPFVWNKQWRKRIWSMLRAWGCREQKVHFHLRAYTSIDFFKLVPWCANRVCKPVLFLQVNNLGCSKYFPAINPNSHNSFDLPVNFDLRSTVQGLYSYTMAYMQATFRWLDAGKKETIHAHITPSSLWDSNFYTSNMEWPEKVEACVLYCPPRYGICVSHICHYLNTVQDTGLVFIDHEMFQSNKLRYG